VNTKDIRTFFDTELLPELQDLEAVRKKTRNFFTGMIVSGVPGIILFAAKDILSDGTSGTIVPSIALLACAIYFAFKAYGLYGDYVGQFKQRIVAKLIERINPEWEYSPNKSITKGEYNASGLFQKKYDKIGGDDLITGTVDKTSFRFSELHSEYKIRRKKRDEWKTIFKGVFAILEFNKDIKGKTYVLTDSLLGKIGQKFQNFDSRGELVKLENKQFEKYFAVYGQDQIEPRYILTPSIMEAMVKIRKRYKTNVAFSFIGNHVNIALSVTEDLFEPRVFSSGLNFQDVAKMNDVINLIHTFITELNLNTRIWTKE
jgi:hypothetical protein